MNQTLNYTTIDSFRIIASLLVIAIHTSPLSSFSAEADFFLTRVLARIAVPFFFMVTGFFTVFPLLAEKNKVLRRQIQNNYLKKTALLYGLSILIYLPLGLYAGHYQSLTPLHALRLLFFDGTFYHLWYFPACLIGVLLISFAGKHLSFPHMLTAAFFLYGFGLLGDSYYGLLPHSGILYKLYQHSFSLFSYTRNGIFFAPLFLLLGSFLRTSPKENTPEKVCLFPQSSISCRNRDHRINIAGLIFSFALMTFEAFTLRHFALQRHDSMYLFLIPTMIFLFRLLLQASASLPRHFSFAVLRAASTWIYILHPAAIVAVRAAAKLLSVSFIIEQSFVHYLLVSVSSAACAWIIATFGKKRRCIKKEQQLRQDVSSDFAQFPDPISQEKNGGNENESI